MTETLEAIRGDVLSKIEIKQRGIKMVDGTRGGVELRAPTYNDMIATILMEKGFIEQKHLNAACDYLELKNAVYGFLNVKTMSGILRTGDSSLSREHAEDAYYIACRYLGRNNERVIQSAMHDEADHTLTLIMVIEAYRLAFIRAFEAMDLAKKKIAEQIEKELAI